MEQTDFLGCLLVSYSARAQSLPGLVVTSHDSFQHLPIAHVVSHFQPQKESWTWGQFWNMCLKSFSYFQTNHVSVLKFSISPAIKIPAWTGGHNCLQSTCTYFLACFSWVKNQPTDKFQCLSNFHFVCFLQTIFSKNSNINLLQPISLGYHKKSSNCSFSFFFFSWL